MSDAIIPFVTAAPPIGGPALHALLAGAIDYAGLFPPAALDLPAAVANYLQYRESGDAWALGKFVIPATSLEVLGSILASRGPFGEPVAASVLLGAQVASDLQRVRAFGASPAGRLVNIQSVEWKATAGDLEQVLSETTGRWACYVELPVSEDLDGAFAELSRKGARAKVRTGGIHQAAFPPADMLSRFLSVAARSKVPFKATAGLHHALGGHYPLTYEPAAPTGTMYGYLNVMLAALILWDHGGALSPSVDAALRESSPAAFSWRPDALYWRDQRFDIARLSAFRRRMFHGFGSCSFREPLDDPTLLNAR